MKLYRILTEGTGDMRDRAVAIAEAEFDGLTVLDATGVWLGNPEKSLVIEIAGTDADRDRVLAVAATIRERNAQQGVMVQTVDCAWEVL